MDSDTTQALCDWLLATADDQLILAHRDSEWTGHAPILEEDIALANIAQDELGHGTLWYNLLAKLKGEDENYPDALVYRREATAWRNVQLVELPKNDWAFTMLRQYFMDSYEFVLLSHLQKSSKQDIADIAAKILREELYHLRHSSTWVKRLARGTAESHRRTQNALDQQWGYVNQLFEREPDMEQLIAANIVPDPAILQSEWLNLVEPLLREGELKLPELSTPSISRQTHTPYLDALLDALQKVARLDYQASW